MRYHLAKEDPETFTEVYSEPINTSEYVDKFRNADNQATTSFKNGIGFGDKANVPDEPTVPANADQCSAYIQNCSDTGKCADPTD